MDTKYKSTSETIFKARHLLVLMLVFAVIYFLGAHEGIYYSDDLAYSEFAGRLVNGTFDVTDNGHTFIHRPTVFVPTSILYHLFGVNILTYSFWPFLCTIGCIYITYKVAHQHDLNAAVASVFLAFTFYFIYFINFLYPDNIVAFFVLIAASTYFSVLYGENNKHLFKAIVFTTSLFLAGLTKETAVVVLPFFMYHAIRAFMKRSALQKFWVYSLVTGLVLLLSYFTWYYIETGDPFYRISEMEKANMVYDNYLNNPSKSYFPRLTVAPIEVLISTGSFITLIFLLGGEKMLEDTDLKKKYYWLFLFLTAYLTLNFSSTSLSVYNPIKLDARMYNLVLPALAISASYGFNKKLNSIKFTLAYTLIFSLTAIYLTNKVGVIYGLLALYFAAHAAWLYFKPHKIKPLPYTAIAAIIVILGIRPAYFILKEKTLYYQEHKQLMELLVQQADSDKTSQAILPDYLYHGTNYYLKYNKVKGLTFYSYSEMDSTKDFTGKFILINLALNTNPSFHQASPHEYLLKLSSQGKLIWKRAPLELYEL